MVRHQPGSPGQPNPKGGERADSSRNLQVARERLDQLNGILEQTHRHLGEITPNVVRLEANLLATRTIGSVTERPSHPEPDRGSARAAESRHDYPEIER